MNAHQVSRDVYELARSNQPIAGLVAEALEVIELSLETHGYVRVRDLWLAR